MSRAKATSEGQPNSAPAGAAARGAGGAALEVRGVVKRFGATTALAGVDMTVAAGTVHGLLGANGAGKSTLVEIVAGSIGADEGELRLAGAPHTPSGIPAAERAGVVAIHQTLSLPENMKAFEYLHFGRPTPRRLGAFVDWGAMRAQVADAADRVGLGDALDTEIGLLHPAHRRMLAIGRALNVHDARLLLLDEPTVDLDRASFEHLVDQVRRLTADGVAVLLVSHRLDEVFSLCDTATVLSAGKVAFDGAIEELSPQRVVDLLSVRSREQAEPAGEGSEAAARAARHRGVRSEAEPVLELRGIETRRLRDFDLTVRAGEVVGLAGLAGSGRSSACRAIFGAERVRAGTVAVAGKPVRSPSPAALMRRGAFFVPDSRAVSLLATHSVRENTSLANLRRVGLGGLPWLDRKRENRLAEDVIERWEVHPGERDRRINTFSGGNQQKVAIGKWLTGEVRLLVLDEPAAGIDPGTKQALFDHFLLLAAEEGCALLLTSSDARDLEAICDRIVVLQEGRVTAELVGAEECREEAILTASLPEVVR